MTRNNVAESCSHASPSASPQRSDALSARIPSLANRNVESASASTSTESVNEKLARARASIRTSRDTSGNNGSESASSSSSSSSNVGLRFLAASRLKQAEVAQSTENRSLRRKLAGPVPPQSWKTELLGRVGPADLDRGRRKGLSAPTSVEGDDERRRGDSAVTGLSGLTSARPRCFDYDAMLYLRRRRREMLRAWRSVRPPRYRHGTRGLDTLRGICAGIVAAILHFDDAEIDAAFEPSQAESILLDRYEVASLPAHIRSFIVDVAGSGDSLCGLSDFAIRAVEGHSDASLHDDEEIDGDSQSTRPVGSAANRDGAQDDDDDDDDWELEASSDVPFTDAIETPFSSVSYGMLKSQIQPPKGTINAQLTTLNLAGRNLGSGSLLKLISHSCPNLTTLCLAGCVMKGYEPAMCKSFWAGCSKLQTLDASDLDPTVLYDLACGLHSSSRDEQHPKALKNIFIKDERYSARLSWATSPESQLRVRQSVKDRPIEGTWEKLHHYEADTLERLQSVRGVRLPYHVSSWHAYLCRQWWARVLRQQSPSHGFDWRDESFESCLWSPPGEGFNAPREMPPARRMKFDGPLSTRPGELSEEVPIEHALILFRDALGSSVDIWASDVIRM
ncbi:unnamed protein product [Jaminaea pallidilutea]